MKDSNPAPTALDNLIAKHELPALAAIFIDPGVLPTISSNAQNRYERIFEYDSLSDRFASFLVEELIPEVGKHYNVSTNPNARALVGVSTGAVGAFVAAWNRPDQFRRVISFIGTYVAMKGADSLPALIRKTEPKPLRIFLQDGRNDHIAPNQPFGTFYAGSWPMNNEVSSRLCSMPVMTRSSRWERAGMISSSVRPSCLTLSVGSGAIIRRPFNCTNPRLTVSRTGTPVANRYRSSRTINPGNSLLMAISL